MGKLLGNKIKSKKAKDKSLRAEEGTKSRTKLRFVILFQIEQGAAYEIDKLINC